MVNKKMKGKRGMGKKAQLTIFIILGLLILVVLILLFARGGDLGTIFVAKTPMQQIEDCAKVPVKEGIDKLSLQGGSIDPENYYLYEGNKVEYVCYTDENLKTCVMQKPILTNSIGEGLKSYSEGKIRVCLNGVKKSLEKKGYSVSMKPVEVSIELVPDNVLVNMDLSLSISKDGTESYDNVKVGVRSKIYNLVIVASSIMSLEARFGDSESLNYMLIYPSLKVEKKKQGDGSKIYIITDRDSNERFLFAVKSFVIPPGIIEVRE